MSDKKKPDNIVFDTKSNRYDAALKPYATNVGAPSITTNDTVAWKNTNIHKINKYIHARYSELKSAYDALMIEYEHNNLLYRAKFNFEPIVGETYHLYRDKKEQAFLSVIAPNECNFDFVGSFHLKAGKVWEKTS